MLDKNYFNRRAVQHIIMAALCWFIIDITILNFDIDRNAFSKSFYLKAITCFVYLSASKRNTPSFMKKQGSIEFSAHFLLSIFCLWVGVRSYILINTFLSAYYGFFVIAGSIFSGYIGLNLLELYKQRYPQNVLSLTWFALFLKVVLLILFCFAFLIFVNGEWVWDIKMFTHWR